MQKERCFEMDQETTTEIKLTFCLAHHIDAMKIWATFEVSIQIVLFIKHVLK